MELCALQTHHGYMGLHRDGLATDTVLAGILQPLTRCNYILRGFIAGEGSGVVEIALQVSGTKEPAPDRE